MKNKWIIFGVIAAVGGLGYLYLKSKSNAAAAASTPPQYTVTSPTDLSSVASMPGTGFNAGNPYTGYNGLSAGVSNVSLVAANGLANWDPAGQALQTDVPLSSGFPNQNPILSIASTNQNKGLPTS